MFFILDIHRLLNMSMATHMKKPLPHSRRVSPRGTLTCATVCTHEAIHAPPIWGRLDRVAAAIGDRTYGGTDIGLRSLYGGA